MSAVDRIIGGLEKKNKIFTRDEKWAVAVHEAGHATISWMLQYADPLVKVTIVPRGMALGAAWYLPEERQLITKENLLDKTSDFFMHIGLWRLISGSYAVFCDSTYL